MNFNFRATIFFSFQRSHCGHIAAYAVANDSKIFPIHLNFFAILSDPFGGSKNLIDLLWILRIGSGCVVDEDSGKSCQNYKIPYHSFVCWLITQYPSTTVNKDENRKFTFGP